MRTLHLRPLTIVMATTMVIRILINDDDDYGHNYHNDDWRSWCVRVNARRRFTGEWQWISIYAIEVHHTNSGVWLTLLKCTGGAAPGIWRNTFTRRAAPCSTVIKSATRVRKLKNSYNYSSHYTRKPRSYCSSTDWLQVLRFFRPLIGSIIATGINSTTPSSPGTLYPPWPRANPN